MKNAKLFNISVTNIKLDDFDATTDAHTSPQNLVSQAHLKSEDTTEDRGPPDQLNNSRQFDLQYNNMIDEA